MKKIVVLLVALFFVAVGCAPKAVQTTPPVGSAAGAGGDTSLSDKDKTGISEEELAKAERDRLLREQERLAGILRDILFDFDSYAVNSSELPKIEGVGSFLKQDRGARLVIEGHCDERGTVEYNLALGQKRAESVKDYLVKMGIETSRLRTISYGKEVPVETGRSEEAWSKNRRVHFKLDQKG
ncbi:MAG TPA: peptidoglycan-associated lipoprotein [Deltaproteobacteria bacterium]|nr:peptidoglycan-associated lipoprotein [Deltaproteobacteria bacterium]